MKSKSTATKLAFVFGWAGGHKFYLGESGTGALYAAFCWTFIPLALSLFQGLNLLSMSKAAFDARYNGRVLAVAGGIQQQSTNVVVNVAPPPAHGATPAAPQEIHRPTSAQTLPSGDVAARIKDLHELMVAGALTETEFTSAKQKLLTSAENSPS